MSSDSVTTSAVCNLSKVTFKSARFAVCTAPSAIFGFVTESSSSLEAEILLSLIPSELAFELASNPRSHSASFLPLDFDILYFLIKASLPLFVLFDKLQ